MPWIFIALLLTNMIFFGWNLTQVSHAVAVQVQVTDTTPADKRLALASERPDLVSKTSSGDSADSGADVSSAESAPADACYTVGPFVGDLQPDQFISRMEAKSLVTKIVPRQNDTTDYWVFVSPQENRDRAEQKVDELKHKGIDSFVVTDEPYANAISLGHFTQEDLATSYRDKMVAQNISAEMRGISHSDIENWVYVAPGTSKVDVRAVIDAAIAHARGLQRQPASCET